MKVLTKRQRDLINILASQSGWRSTAEIAQVLNISASTLRRDIDTVNDYFFGKENKVSSKPGMGLMLENCHSISLPGEIYGNNVKNILKRGHEPSSLYLRPIEAAKAVVEHKMRLFSSNGKTELYN
ncbi:HTH domain-containing protein [Buttiauxella sp. 3AFRM03]|uniref:HTH domain-containing protein n=1 Tax=Buttiauxella sp. 3AFRM03 TaxID=2479367 RepID=UPI00138FBF37|nr:HTH domain-containing protein [Buttiauxella sp. 3AFRM03]